MLIQRQLTNRILGDAQRLRKESLELRHDCRNTRSISLLLRNLLQEERKSRPSGPLGILIQTIRRRARHDLLRQLKGCVYTRGLQWSNSLSCPVSSRICCECRTGADGAYETKAGKPRQQWSS